MKFLNSFFFLFLIVTQLSGQTIKGKVVDSENFSGLTEVYISTVDSTFSTKTDNNGLFSLPKTNRYTFSKRGYATKTIVITNIQNPIIELTPVIESLNEVIIISNNFKSKLKTLSTAISIIDPKTINSQNSINIAPVLNTVPGVYMHNGTLTTNRITIRGIGSRNPFGTSKIRAYYKDIPLTNGNGTSTIEDIEMGTLGRIEILKGPSSSIYGAGLGGSIQLIPENAKFNNTQINNQFSFGSFGLKKHYLQGDLSNLKNAINFTYSNLHSDGYRKNNNTDRQTLTLATNHYIGEKDKLSFIGNYINLKAFIPSSLNENDYLNNPTSAAFTWGNSKGFEDYDKGLFGVSWEHNYNINTKQYLSIFTSFLNTYEPRPFNILEEQTNGLGLRTRIASKAKFLKKSLEWTFGGEFFYDRNSYQTYQNLYEEVTSETMSIKGDKLSDFKEKRRYFNIFFDSKYHLSNNFIASFGINANQTWYSLDDTFNNDGEDVSGNYKFNTIISPKFGLTKLFGNNSMLYATISHGFSPPTLEETLLPDGLINTNIKPESGWNYEIGSRGSLFKNKLDFDLAVYKMIVKNLLVARRNANDEFIGINAGKTIYNGIEALINYQLIKTDKIKITHANNLALNNFNFKEFIDDSNDLSGNDLTGIPDLTFNSILNFEIILGLYTFLTYNYVGEMPIRDDNSIYSDKYQLVHTKIGYKSNPDTKLQYDVFLGVNNVFDQKYASMLLINAGSFGSNAPRYYYPGEPTNYYAGFNLKYLF